MKPVNPDLDLLIKYLEAEQKSLKRMIKDAGVERDNLIIYYHSESLLDLDRRLEILRQFKDPFYNQKRELKRRIGNRKKELFTELSEPIRERFKKRNEQKIAELEAELQKLNEEPSVNYPDTQIINEALFSLYDRRCKSFKLVIAEEEGVSLQFKIKKDLLIIILNGNFNLWADEPDFVLDSRIPKKLEAIGFQLNARNKYYQTFDFKDFNNADAIKLWLSRVIIDFFCMSGASANIQLVY